MGLICFGVGMIFSELREFLYVSAVYKKHNEVGLSELIYQNAVN